MAKRKPGDDFDDAIPAGRDEAPSDTPDEAIEKLRLELAQTKAELAEAKSLADGFNRQADLATRECEQQAGVIERLRKRTAEMGEMLEAAEAEINRLKRVETDAELHLNLAGPPRWFRVQHGISPPAFGQASGPDEAQAKYFRRMGITSTDTPATVANCDAADVPKEAYTF